MRTPPRLIGTLAVSVIAVALVWGITERGAHSKKVRGGRIVGTVRITGKVPARKPLDRRADPFCAQHRQLSEDIVADGGGLRDVFVGIAPGQISSRRKSQAPVVIEQTQCMYRPRVVGVLPGQDIAIKNGDPTLHNIHAYQDTKTLFNLAQPPRAPALTRKAPKKTGEIVTLKCDVHPWMRAYAVVTDNPHFAVTQKGGTFTIDDIPPGRYRVETWHPVLGKQTATVTVRAGKTARLNLTYEAK